MPTDKATVLALVGAQFYQVPWNGVDDTAALAAAVTACAYPNNRIVLLQPGKIYKLYSTLVVGQQFKMVGTMGADRGGEIWYYGADGTNCIQSASSGSTQQSQFRMQGVRIVDKRTNPTSGSGIYLDNVVNGTFMDDVFVGSFPTYQIAVRADSGQAGDCVDLRRIWLGGTTANNIGIYIIRTANNVNLDWIAGDTTGGGAMIVIDTITANNCVVDIRNVKHEPNDNLTPTVYFPTTSYGNVSCDSIIQRPQGSNTGNTIIKFAQAQGRFVCSNITGSAHTTWGTNQPALEDVATSAKVWGPVLRAAAGTGGRFNRYLVGNGAPNAGGIYGNPGDLYFDSGATGTVPCQWVKWFGAATATGWWPTQQVGYAQTINYAASITPALQSGNVVTVGTLTGDITVNNPSTNLAINGETSFLFTQDASAGHAVSWGANYKFPTAFVSGSAATNGQKSFITFKYDGTYYWAQGTNSWV